MRNLLCIFIVLLCTITFTGQSADTEPSLRDNPFKRYTVQQPAPKKQKPKFQVEVSVTCKDENTKAFIESHIKRELRSLQDVEIVAILGKYQLSIVAIESEYEASGRKSGEIALASQFLRYYNPSLKITYLGIAYPVGSKEHTALMEASSKILSWTYDKARHRLNVGMRDNLDKICKSIVVSFDTLMLEPDRKN